MLHIEIKSASFDVEATNVQFWDNMTSGNWEATTLEVFRQCIDEKTTFVDVGAWIGPTTLFAANFAKRVISIEADPVAASQLNRNVGLNPRLKSKIEVIEKAISQTTGTVRLGARTGRGDSMSSLLFANNEDCWEVPTITPVELSRLLLNEEKIFIKMDIEGGEYGVLPHFTPVTALPNATFLIAFHPKFLPGNSLWSLKTALMTAKAMKSFGGYNLTLVKKKSVRNLPIFSLLNKVGWAAFPVHHSILASK